MGITPGEAVSLISVILSALALVIGLPAATYSARKQLAEAKSFLAKEAESYSKAAQQAVESQANLQNQINELREQLESRDKLIDNLQKEIGKRDSRILDLEDQIESLHKGQDDKDKQIKALEQLTELQAQEIKGLRKEVKDLSRK